MDPIFRHRFKILLGSLVGLILVSPVLLEAFIDWLNPWSNTMAILGATTITLVAAAFAVSGRRGALVFAIGLVIPSFLLEFATWTWWPAKLIVCHYLVRIVFFGFISIELLRQLFLPSKVTFDTICASLCVYILLGVLWANIFALTDTIHPGSFRVDPVHSSERMVIPEAHHALLMLYFSFVTLSGVGYGDILPITITARMFAVTEALMGQAYLLIMVSRLVGLHTSQYYSTRAESPNPAFHKDHKQP